MDKITYAEDGRLVALYPLVDSKTEGVVLYDVFVGPEWIGSRRTEVLARSWAAYWISWKPSAPKRKSS